MIRFMFEFSIALAYLLPHRSRKTLSFVGILASCVISVIVWLLIVFVSITHSVEHQWLSKMTSLSAPLRIKPTQAYFDSYYSQIDKYCESSNYTPKSLKEKLQTACSDPFDPDVDENIAHLPLPHRDQFGELIDPVKRVDTLLARYKAHNLFSYEEYALSAGAFHLNFKKEGVAQTLNQILYVTSYAQDSLARGQLIEPWDQDDLNHLIKNESLEHCLWSLDEILNTVIFDQIKLEPFSLKAPESLSLKNPCPALAVINAEGRIKSVMLLTDESSKKQLPSGLKLGLYNMAQKSFDHHEAATADIYLDSLNHITLTGIKNTPSGRKFLIKGEFGSKTYFFELSPKDFKLTYFKLRHSCVPLLQKLLLKPNGTPPYPVLAPKTFKEQGAKIGDKGFISYGAKTLSGFQEMKAPVIVAGFYDPGLFSVGAKVLIAPREVIDIIGTSATTYALEASETNGFLLFPNNFSQAKKIKNLIINDLNHNQIGSYFEVQTYHDYPFVKEILEQFASDKLIFYLVASIILIVALSNVIFLMQLLVRDKSHDMAILRSLGATQKQIGKIFIICGSIIGVASVLIALSLSFLTLHFIEPLLHALSVIVGQGVNLSQFYGLAHQVRLDHRLGLSILIIVPLLCSIATLISLRALRKKTCIDCLKEPK